MRRGVRFSVVCSVLLGAQALSACAPFFARAQNASCEIVQTTKTDVLENTDTTIKCNCTCPDSNKPIVDLGGVAGGLIL
jgi:hypothetical protein